jgi:fatty-acyl-CoA synthase
MQHHPLMISDLLRHAETSHGNREIVSRLVDEPIWRYRYGDMARRCARAAGMLRRFGVGPGDIVTSLAWNTHRHLELFYAVPGIGAILHTANPRFSDEQIIYTTNHAQSKVLFFDKNFSPLIQRIRPQLHHVRYFVGLTQHGRMDAPIDGTYEALIKDEPDALDWPLFDEDAGAFLCYTSGTTGKPKGVLYSHRSIILHAMAAGLASAFGVSAFDCIMPCQSLYHATAWGLPFVALLNGCKFVLPCDKFDGASLQQLIKKESVTFSGGVPTIWTMYLAHLEVSGDDAGALQRVVIGGSAVPRAMAETFLQRYGVKVLQIWGMTETSPLGVMSTPTPSLLSRGTDAMNDVLLNRQGRLQFGIELKIVNDKGEPLPRDGVSAGALHVRGPWTVERYFRSDSPAVDEEGWFNTGDIATIDCDGYLRLTDRAKDVIKSGGEWISSIDIENIVAGCPGVKIAAVIGVTHPKWEERPLLLVELHEGAVLTHERVLAFLAPHIPKWWMPDVVIFDTVPLTATGKIEKKLLRDRYCDYLLRRDGRD